MTKIGKDRELIFYGKQTVLERIKNLHGRKPYEEKKATKLGFKSLHDYFEDKVVKETQAVEEKKQNKSVIKKN